MTMYLQYHHDAFDECIPRFTYFMILTCSYFRANTFLCATFETSKICHQDVNNPPILFFQVSVHVCGSRGKKYQNFQKIITLLISTFLSPCACSKICGL